MNFFIKPQTDYILIWLSVTIIKILHLFEHHNVRHKIVWTSSCGLILTYEEKVEHNVLGFSF